LIYIDLYRFIDILIYIDFAFIDIDLAYIDPANFVHL